MSPVGSGCSPTVLTEAPVSLLSLRILKTGIILLDPVNTQVARILALQYNPDQLKQHVAGAVDNVDAGDRSEALWL